MTYAIVAIPEKNDQVWELSSEKVPHMTILAFGDNLKNEPRVVDFLGHVVNTSLCRFGLMVDRRDVLGPEEADVLFFEKYGLKKLVDARANLLREPNILAAYNSIEQYPQWTPHLTLGYPATPAKPNKKDYPPSYVRFDKIALWTGDYEGPEFELDENYGLLSDEQAGLSYMSQEVLQHFGVLGMRWGQRKSSTPGVSRGTDHAAKKDAKEFARAKQFYGEGAGTRRKLIKATVEGKSKRDPSYAKAFEKHLANQDMATHAAKARSERKRKDTVNTTAKTARGVRNILNGNSKYASLGAAMLVGGAMYAHKAGIDKIVLNAGKTAVSNLKGGSTLKAGMKASDFLRTMGVNP